MLKVAVEKHRGEFTLQANFEAPTPGIVALFGRSGCGKTSTINIVSGLLQADKARIELDGHVIEDTEARIRIPAEGRRMGYVFQDGRLFPHLSVLGNLRYGLRRAQRKEAEAAPAEMRIAFETIITLLGLERLLDRRPRELSGGERQRVSLGRALLSQPRLLLLDEPLAALDLARREEVLPYLERLRDSLSIPMIYVSHQFEEVLRLASHVVLMSAGRVLAQGSLNEVSLLPELRSIVGLDAVGAVLEGRVSATDTSCGMATLQVPGGVLNVSVRNVSRGDQVRVQLLARDIILAIQPPRGLSVRNELAGNITSIAQDEDDAMLVYVDVGGARVLARVTREAAIALGLQVGTQVWVLVKAVSARGFAFRPAGS